MKNGSNLETIAKGSSIVVALGVLRRVFSTAPPSEYVKSYHHVVSQLEKVDFGQVGQAALITLGAGAAILGTVYLASKMPNTYQGRSQRRNSDSEEKERSGLLSKLQIFNPPKKHDGYIHRSSDE